MVFVLQYYKLHVSISYGHKVLMLRYTERFIATKFHAFQNYEINNNNIL